ncbi:DUF2069 domain-containing protein [Halomonas urumqiensis]|uniref:DUF2069 domain-containing protein n=1 Tax=Halomonas urumqiensis TaxID=1684789 RepID=A0A2N7UEM7_9GAMM|nr:DUF2069 domain-containing protein [Halomonas urumqiensis]PMR78902.1 DUF2069 domain-containing protein [Halomonas urumqiensis]PTB04192.1 DUF2069 domain-containing protein [Halomonas urumqiensis]GHE19536.1 hypothetical protein GCM10017767_00570 [Halomonas urumqiensis]
MRQWLEALEARRGLDDLTARSRRWVIGSYALLLALMLYRGVLVDTEANPWMPLVAFALPLVLFLPSIIGRRPRGHAWLSFVSLLYFTQGVMIATLPGQGLRGLAESLVSLALFTGCMGYARFRSRQMKAFSDS